MKFPYYITLRFTLSFFTGIINVYIATFNNYKKPITDYKVTNFYIAIFNDYKVTKFYITTFNNYKVTNVYTVIYTDYKAITIYISTDFINTIIIKRRIYINVYENGNSATKQHNK